MVQRGEIGHRERAVVCLSGGMDSCVCAALAAREYDAYALHCSYGQRTEEREMEAAHAVADALEFQDFCRCGWIFSGELAGRR